MYRWILLIVALVALIAVASSSGSWLKKIKCGHNHACIEHVARIKCTLYHDAPHCDIYHRWLRKKNLAHAAAITHVLTPDQCATVSCLQHTAYSMALAKFGSVEQANCEIDIISNHEDGSWEPVVPGQSVNGPWGLPQADPGTKMAAAGPDWETNGVTQLKWMILMYIPQRWGTPCNADYNERIASYY